LDYLRDILRQVKCFRFFSVSIDQKRINNKTNKQTNNSSSNFVITKFSTSFTRSRRERERKEGKLDRFIHRINTVLAKTMATAQSIRVIDTMQQEMMIR
jgi:hypothetical protein